MLDIEFKDYKKKQDIHGTVLYPAVMVGPVQKVILNEVLENNKNYTILDPFHGSGTSLYEAFEINPNLNLVGIDINPLANLITKCKLQGVDENIKEDISLIEKILIDNQYKYNTVSFDNIDKWFRKDIISDLSKIKSAVGSIGSKKNRMFFWCMFTNIIRRYSNTRSSTYKLHAKKDEQIINIKNNVIKDFIKNIKTNYLFYDKSSKNFSLIKGDVLKTINLFGNESIDVLITSPPYGDNATTVTYGQFSILLLFWIDKEDLELDGWEFDNFSKIDRESLGGYNKYDNVNVEETINYIKCYLNEMNEEDKRRKVKVFFNDYFNFLKESIRVVKEYIIITLGNRTVNGINIDLVDITKRYLKDNEFEVFLENKRKIYSKRTPRTLRINNEKTISSMNDEFIIVFKKKKVC